MPSGETTSTATETPIVAVDLAYDDEANGVHATHSVTLDTDNRATGWAQPIKDASAVGFRYRIAWFDKTGHPKQGEWADSLVPRIVIPAAG